MQRKPELLYMFLRLIAWFDSSNTQPWMTLCCCFSWRSPCWFAHSSPVVSRCWWIFLRYLTSWLLRWRLSVHSQSFSAVCFDQFLGKTEFSDCFGSGPVNRCSAGGHYSGRRWCGLFASIACSRNWYGVCCSFVRSVDWLIDWLINSSIHWRIDWIGSLGWSIDLMVVWILQSIDLWLID